MERMIMQLIQKIGEELADEFNRLKEEYSTVLDELEKYGKIPFTYEYDDIDKVNKIVNELQKKFADLYPVIRFVKNAFPITDKIESDFDILLKQIIESGIERIKENEHILQYTEANFF